MLGNALPSFLLLTGFVATSPASDLTSVEPSFAFCPWANGFQLLPVFLSPSGFVGWGTRGVSGCFPSVCSSTKAYLLKCSASNVTMFPLPLS